MEREELPPGLFTNTGQALRNITATHEAFLRSGAQSSIDTFSQLLEQFLQASPDADLALTSFLRFSEAAVSKASLFDDFVRYPDMLDVLMRIFGASRYFTDILVREPGLFRWLTGADVLMAPATKQYLAVEADRVMRTFQKAERRLDALKRLARREVLRVGAQDLLGNADLGAVTLQLSDLADVLIDAACRIAHQELRESFGAGPETTFAVIGLGKLGGRELNYSSDIDVLFVYRDEGEGKKEKTQRGAGGTFTYHEFFNKLAERIIRNLSWSSGEGHLYRVDTRLRPEAGAGPLARSLRSYLIHYESRGELWERQMLIKARTVAGDQELGAEFLRQVEPFVYPRTHFQNPAEYVARIKARIETAVGDEANIKLMAGGIRDIEFIVQTLQLVNGGRTRSIRSENTLESVRLLAGHGLLAQEEADLLVQAYTFFRTLEHRLQTMLYTQTHTLPDDPRTSLTLARRMGLPSAEEMDRLKEGHLRSVRRIFEQVLSVAAPSETESITALVDGGVREDLLRRILGKYGFREHRQSAKNVRLLVSGNALVDEGSADRKSRDAFRMLAEPLFTDIARTPDPDLTLNSLVMVAAAQKFPDLFFSQLAEAGYRKFILQVCALSPRFARGLARSPLLLESVASDVASLSGEGGDAPARPDDLVEFKSQRELRSGIRHILGFTGFDELTAELSALADTVSTAVLYAEARKRGVAKDRLALFALGKYGTRELSFDADLDIVIVADEQEPEANSRIEQVAAATIQRLTAVTEKGRLYDVDARLRPEGKNSPLVADVSAYGAYLRERASLWERQALTRLRFVCGSPALGSAVTDTVRRMVYEAPLPPDWIERTVAMRRKMETRSRFQGGGFHDIKLGAGGMADIEFLAQMYQIREGGVPGMPRRVPEVLGAMSPDVVSPEEATRLSSAYALFRKLETLMHITIEERGSILPEGKKLDTLARVIDGSTGEALSRCVESTMKEVRRSFLDISQRMSPTTTHR